MSYILEALRRAERERAQGQLPGADPAAAAGTPPASRGPVLALVVALLAINLVVLIVMLMRHKPDAAAKPGSASAMAIPQSQVDRAALPNPASAPITVPAPPDAIADAPDEAVVQQGVSSMDDLGASGESDQPAAAEPAPHVEHQLPRGSVTFSKKPLTGKIAKPLPPPDPENDAVDPDAIAADEGQPVLATTEEPAEEASAPPPAEIASVQPITRTAPPSAALPSGTSVKALSDMSAAYQASFPHFVLEVHVYDPSPQRRFAIIGGQRFHEGDVMPQGPRLVQIVSDGLVLDFHNERVLYPLGRH